jgi:RHS repeat-associated protein
LGNRKGVNQIASLGSTTINRRDNGLNQYLNWTQSPINYESNGVLYQDGWITAYYNALNQPLSIWSWRTNPSGSTIYFAHDPLGRCVKRTNDGGISTYLYYDGWNLIQEGPTAATGDRIYAHGNRVDEIVASQYGGAWAYHHYDARGHCILLTNASGGIQEQYDYDAFGKAYFYNTSGVSQTSSGWGNRFLFTGREWLKDIAVYDFRNRHYLPELGRFIQPDPMGFTGNPNRDGYAGNTFLSPWSVPNEKKSATKLDTNFYRYCHNDPVNIQDPNGLGFLEALGRVLNATRPLHERLVNALKLFGKSNKQAEKIVNAGERAAAKGTNAAIDVGNQVPGGPLNAPQTPAGVAAVIGDIIRGGVDALNEGSFIDLNTGKVKQTELNYRPGWWKNPFPGDKGD